MEIKLIWICSISVVSSYSELVQSKSYEQGEGDSGVGNVLSI